MFGSSRQRAWIVAAVLGLAGGVAVWFWLRREPDSPPPARTPAADPRVAASAVWSNIHPDVKYVGDAVCAGCHRDITRTYSQHPMGRSLAPSATATTIERLDAAAHNPFAAGAFRYDVEHQDGRMRHRERAVDDKGNILFERQVDVDFAVGSGRRGRSYLINDGGLLFMSPITWYPQKEKGIWDLSPGYERSNAHFTRPIVADCLFCHSNRVEPVSDSTHRYEEPVFRGHAVGCERCHGPGELHAAKRRQRDGGDAAEDAVDHTIVNPRRLSHALREAVCQQCHLQGEERVPRRGRTSFEFRPGMPVQEFFVDYVKPAKYQSEPKFVGTEEQMVASRCYQESAGEQKLGCTSCHDPHALPPPAQKLAYYRARCQTCHTDQACRIALAVRRKDNGDNCVACHMPPTGSEINHTSVTDHRIVRRADADGARFVPPWPPLNDLPLVPFHRATAQGGAAQGAAAPGAAAPAAPDADRDLGVALMQLADHQPPQTMKALARTALPLLEAAQRRDADDLAAAERRADALWPHGRLEDALAAYQTILARAPRREFTLHRAAALALRLKRFDVAEDFIRRALALNPRRWESHHDLATLQALRLEWKAALATSRQTLAINPASIPSRSLVIVCYLKLGDRAQAQAEFDTFLQLHPAEKRQAARDWFARESK